MIINKGYEENGMSLKSEGKGAVNTKERVQHIAIELFQKHGYENVTINQICHEAGITKRSFYYHYSSKAELLHGLIDMMGVQAETLMDSLAEQHTNIGTLWTLMSVYAVHSANYGPEIIRQIYTITIQGETEEDFPYSTYLYNTVVKTLKSAKDAGEIKSPVAAEDLAFALYHGFRSVSMTWASTGGAFDEVEAFRRIFSATLGITKDSF